MLVILYVCIFVLFFLYGKLLVYATGIVIAMSPEGFYTLVMDVLSLWKQLQPRSVIVYYIYPTLRFESVEYIT